MAREQGDGRGRRPHARAVQPRQGALPGGRVHQGRGHRLLRRASPTSLLPHLADRMLTRKRWPDGTGAPAVLREERARAARRTGCARSSWPSTATTASSTSCADDAADPGLARQPRRARAARPAVEGRRRRTSRKDADLLVFDLDPGPPADDRRLLRRRAALLRELLEHDGLTAYPKTSGNKGAQLYVPIEPTPAERRTSAYAKRLADELADGPPRPRALVDGQEGAAGQGLHRLEPEQRREDDDRAVLAARHRPADRLDPADLGRGRRARDRRPTCVFTAADVVDRLEEYGDLLADMDEHRAALPERGAGARRASRAIAMPRVTDATPEPPRGGRMPRGARRAQLLESALRRLRRPGLPRGRDGRHRRARRRLETRALPALPRQARALPRAARRRLRRGWSAPSGRRSASTTDNKERVAATTEAFYDYVADAGRRVPAGVRVRPDQRAGGARAGRPGHRCSAPTRSPR